MEDNFKTTPPPQKYVCQGKMYLSKPKAIHQK